MSVRKFFPPFFEPVLRSLENARRNLRKAAEQGEILAPDALWAKEIRLQYVVICNLLNSMVSAAIKTNEEFSTSASPGEPHDL